MRLVIQASPNQGSTITFPHLAHIHQLCATSVQFTQIAEHAYYLANQNAPIEAVQQFCAQQKIDCAYVEDKQLLKNYGLCVMDNPGAVEWVATCKANNISTLLVSGGFTFFAERVKEMLNLDYAVSNTLEIIDGKLTGKLLGNIVDAQTKADELIKLRDKLGLSSVQTIAIGDGANDLKMMSAAGIGIAYHAKPIVQTQATYALNHVGLDGVANLLKT